MFWHLKCHRKVSSHSNHHKSMFYNLFNLSAVKYRSCDAIKNVLDSQGKRIKTICALEFDQSHTWHRRNCESLHMTYAKIDSPEAETTMKNLCNARYTRFNPGWIYYYGTLGNGRVRCLSNEGAGRVDNYRQFQCGDGDGNFALCEFSTPRSK
jgi:hypothetical protein